MVQKLVELTEEEVEKLEELARWLDVPAQELLHSAVNNLLRTPVAPARVTEEQRRRAAAIPSFDSGPSDLSANHDKYFAEAIEERWRST